MLIKVSRVSRVIKVIKVIKVMHRSAAQRGTFELFSFEVACSPAQPGACAARSLERRELSSPCC